MSDSRHVSLEATSTTAHSAFDADPGVLVIPESGSATAPVAFDDGLELPLLTRLNNRGFRLIQLADVVALVAVMLGTVLVRYGWDWPTYSKSLYAVSFGVTLGVYVATFYFGGLYEREPRLGRPPFLPRVARQALGATGLVALINLGGTSIAQDLGYITQRVLPMPIANLVVLMVVGSIAVGANRRAAEFMRRRREGPPKVLLVGTATEALVARSNVRDDEAHATVVGEATSLDGIEDQVDRLGATDVLLLSGDWLDEVYPVVLENLEDRDVSVLQRVTAKETLYGLERVRQIGGLPFVLLRSHALPRSRARFKRAFELVLVLVASPLILMMLAAVALYQVVVAGRPVLFWQDRVGAAGRRFRMVKFRTMRRNAEEDGNPLLATRNDPRIIPACRWLRASRLDELPQIYNILRGEMSLVGPRPERPELTAEFERLIPGYSRRHEVPPGLTGLAQIHGRYHTDAEYKLGYDLQYLVNWSPVLDLEIIARTVWVVVTGRI